MHCSEKSRLIIEYSNCTDAYRLAVAELRKYANPAAASLEEYIELSVKAEQARLVCEKARLALEEHVIKHKC